jgi:hypothetical protein
MINLSLDLYQIECHAQEYMRKLGITYELATPQSIADCWWFWNCKNFPDPLPAALRVLEITPREAVGYGLSNEMAKQLEESVASQESTVLTDEQILALSQHHMVSYTMSDGKVVHPLQDGSDMRDSVLSFARDLIARCENRQ